MILGRLAITTHTQLVEVLSIRQKSQTISTRLFTEHKDSDTPPIHSTTYLSIIHQVQIEQNRQTNSTLEKQIITCSWYEKAFPLQTITNSKRFDGMHGFYLAYSIWCYIKCCGFVLNLKKRNVIILISVIVILYIWCLFLNNILDINRKIHLLPFKRNLTKTFQLLGILWSQGNSII